MNILASLQSRKVGLIQLLLMGLYVYLKNWKPILLVFSIVALPFLTFFATFPSLLQDMTIGEILVFRFVLSFFCILPSIIYSVAIIVITINYLQGFNTSFQSILRKITTSFIPLLSLTLQFWKNYFLVCLLALPVTISPLFLLQHFSWNYDSGVFLFVADYVSNGAGICYSISNGYYDLAFILRNKSGQEAFDYSCSVVEDNWWRVFCFTIASSLIKRSFLEIFRQSPNFLPLSNTFFGHLLSFTIFLLIGTVIQISSILIFLNLDYRKSIEN